VHVCGTGNVVPEIADTGQAKSLLEIFESSQRVARLLVTEQGGSGVSVSIGSENRYKPMKMLSVVRASYWIGGGRGTVGVIGPLRMQYPRLMALVEYTSNELTRFLAERGGKQKGAGKRRKRKEA
jgi:heat-inducible transcriptional repressor